MICHYRFFNHGFKFQDSVCNVCPDLTILIFNIRDITIITVTNVDYCCIIQNISKSDAINIFIRKCCAWILWVYIKNIALIFSLFKTVLFFFTFLLSLYKMVDIMDIYKSSNISIGTVMNNAYMLKFFPDHLKTKITLSIKPCSWSRLNKCVIKLF